MNKSELLLSLHDKYSQECTCQLKNETRAVYGHGNPEAEVVFIGEAPGKKEEETGIPFVGAAGKFLDEMLSSIKMTRLASNDGARHDFAKSDIYITNIVKYRPPNNRDPLDEEKDACKDWLHAELNLISPKLIVFLGRHSMNHFFPDQKISDAHGKLLIKKIDGINTKHFLPLYHPAAALYNGSMRATLLEDFKKIPLALKKIDESN